MKMKKPAKPFLKISFILVITFFMFNCSDVPRDSSAVTTELDFQSAKLETVPINEGG